MTQETNNLAADLWALADLLRGDFKQSQYGRVIQPFALLRRLECVLESSKSAVLAEAAKVWPKYASRIWCSEKIPLSTSWRPA
jgi:type I restriction enzyme M protein